MGVKRIASLCAVPPNEEYPNGLILAGSKDCAIYGFVFNCKYPVMKLLGHSGVVCSLSARFGSFFVSGSWDKTARIWSGQQCTAVLEGHVQPVWSTEVYPLEDMILTGSADHTIRIWQNGVCKKILCGHEDGVTGLVVREDTNFLSCSNDATVRLWNIKGRCLAVFFGHDDYINSITLLNNGIDFATCSKDDYVKIWKKGLCVHSFHLPSQTLWSIACLSNGDLVVGSSDGLVSIIEEISTDPEPLKVVPSDQSELSVEKQAAIPVYELSPLKNKWVKKKTVKTTEAASDLIDRDMFSLSIKETDYELYIESSGVSLKLAFNRSDNPYEVARKFASEHTLDKTVDQILDLIVRNTDVKLPPKPSEYYPYENYYLYINANIAELKAKLLEFTTCVPKSQHILPSNIVQLIDIVNFPTLVSEQQMQSLDIAMSWSEEYISPVLDFLCLALKSEDVCRRISNSSFLSHLLNILKSDVYVNRILVVKIFCNLFGFEDGEKLMIKFQAKIMKSVKKTSFLSNFAKGQKSCSSLFLNYSVAAHKGLAVDVDIFCTNLVAMLKVITDPKSFYRISLSIGTISVSNYSAFMKLDALNAYEALCNCEKHVKYDSRRAVFKELLDYVKIRNISYFFT